MVRLPPRCEIAPPPAVPVPVAELPVNAQLLIVSVLPCAPETIPPPPTPVVSLPPVMVTPEMDALKFVTRSGLISITRSFVVVC